MSELNSLPLHAFHDAHGARFVDFGGWNMPVQYQGILEEHRAVREAVGLFDVSHMGEFWLRGAQAAEFLDSLLVNRIATASVGKAIYSPMCRADGGVVDDLIVYRCEPDAFLLCVNASNCAKDLKWIQEQIAASGMAVTVEDQSDQYALLAVQGPKAVDLMAGAGIKEAASLGRFRHVTETFLGHEIRIARTGYTGEDGFEIYIPVAGAAVVAEALFEAGQAHDLQLCGLGSRDSLRLEAGLPLYGHELSDSINPLEAGLAWTVKLEKEDFIGKAALELQRDGNSPRQMVYFKLEGRRIARAGTEVLNSEGETVGTVCSGTLSPILNAPIGSALISRSSALDGLNIDLRGHTAALQVAQPPLHIATN
jgi:aminomethyltransferase